ncbi:MAG: hypothetical protein E7610_04740 [Ruminococcaceae bacterium]|nr:hypothetical protein [Oscillospiraceae bacterium]
MKKTRKRITGLLSCFIALIMVIESSMTTAVALGEEVSALLKNSSSGITSNQDGGGGDSVLPDTGADEWDVPTAVTNPNEVNTTVQSYMVYNDEIYEQIAGFLQGYKWIDINENGIHMGRRPMTASLGVVLRMDGKTEDGDDPRYWDVNFYTDSVVRANGTRGIYKDIMTPEFRLSTDARIGPQWVEAHLSDLENYARSLNKDHLSLRVSCDTSGATAKMQLISGAGNTMDYPLYAGHTEVDVPYGTVFHPDYGVGYLDLKFSLASMDVGSTVTNMNVVYVDNTSPSITEVDAYQDDGQLEVCITFNEPVRWAAETASNDLNDIWVDVELQVIGTDVTETVRAHVLSAGRSTKKMYFRGDLGIFKNLDYKIVAIKDVNLPQKEYPISFGVMQMYALQGGSRTYTATDTKYNENRELVPKTTNTTAVCDAAGNPIHLESVVNWPINQREVKNQSTFVRRIEMLNDKTLLGLHRVEEDSFNNSITRADYFFGNGDEVSPRLYFNRVLTAEEVETLRIRLNVQDLSGNYIWLEPKSTGRYYLKGEILCEADKEHAGEEFTYVDFEPVTLKQGMTTVMEDGSTLPFLMVDEIEGTTSPALVTQIPEPSATLYIDLLPPEFTVSTSTATPTLNGVGYYPLTVTVNISDTTIEGKQFSGVLEEFAHVYIGMDVNEETPFQFIVNTSVVPPSDVSAYTGSGSFMTGKKICVTEGRAMGMTSESNTFYVHILIPHKENLLTETLYTYVDVSDVVKNNVDPTDGWSTECYIDYQKPDVTVTGSRVLYDAAGATAEVNISVSDYNNVESIRYQWVENGTTPSDDEWQAVTFTADKVVSQTISKQFQSLDTAKYDMKLFVKAVDEKGNESEAVEYTMLVDLDKPAPIYKVESDLSMPSPHPKITVSRPAVVEGEKISYTRVTVAPLSPMENWLYMTVVQSGESLDLFDLQSGAEWYRVSMSGNFITAVDKVDGETVTLNDLKNYYGNLKISFESAYMDLTPMVGYKNDGVSDGSYFADQNILTARFASQNQTIEDVNSINFGRVVDRDGKQLAAYGGAGTETISFVSPERGVNTMRGLTLYFDITNKKMVDWGVLDIDFERSKVELVQARTTDLSDATVVYSQQGLAHSRGQSFIIPAYLQNSEWFTTGLYYLRVTVVSHCGSTEVAESMHFVFDAGEVTADGLVHYSFNLPFDPQGTSYRGGKTAAENTTLDSFGIALQPTVEAMRNNVFAVYTGGVQGFNFIIGATPKILTLENGITVGEVEGFRYWNSLSMPSAEELEGLAFTKTSREGEEPALSVTSGVESIYTKESIPKGAKGLGDIYLVEGVNTICYQTKMASGYVTPVKQFTIIVTQYVPEFNVAVHDYTPSHDYAQSDVQVNAHDITMIVEEAFSMNGTGNVRVEMWSSYALEVNGTLVEEQGDNMHYDTLDLLTELDVSDNQRPLVTLTKDSYTSCYPPYSGQGSICTAAFVAVDEYGGSVVYAPQIGAEDRLYGQPVEYYGSLQDDPFVIGRDDSFITIYNSPVYYGSELSGFQNLTSRNWGPYEPVEFSIPELEYNLFAISTNHVIFGSGTQSYGSTSNDVYWNRSSITNYDLIDWTRTKITVYEGTTVLAENLDLFSPGPNAAGFMGASYGESYYPGIMETYDRFSLAFADPDKATAENGATEREMNFKIEGVNIYGNAFVVEGSVSTDYIDYTGVTETMTGKGVRLKLPYITADYGDAIYTETFVKGTAITKTVTDMFGQERTISHTLTTGIEADVQIDFSTYKATGDAVTVTLKHNTGEKLYVDITDPGRMSVLGNGTADVSVIVTDNVKFNVLYMKDGQVESVMLEVDHIVKPAPYTYSTNMPSSSLVDPDTYITYMYGTVTVELRDDNYILLDRYTGKIPSHTFYPGSPTSHIFSKDDIVAYFIGDDRQERTEYEIPRDVVVSLGVDELREPIDALAQLESSSATGLKIRAYKNNNGLYEAINSSLVIESYQMSDAFASEDGETQYAFSGYSISAESLLKDLGWGTGFRFVTEYTASVHAKSFIKQGLYPGAPDYETGVSDKVDGVTLNGRLLTVEKNAQFTLYMVSKNGGHVAVAFDVDSIGTAPIPEVVKVPVSNSLVRAYVVFPADENLTDLTVTPADPSYVVKYDTEGEFANIPYVEYTSNSDYLINYTFNYFGAPIEGSASTSICEIRIRELKRLGQIEWSANKMLEATGTMVSATLEFSEAITGFAVTEGELDSEALTIKASGNNLILDYTGNHGPITVRVDSAYGSVVTDIEAVTNIDRTAPEITEISRTLSSDGRTLTVVLAASERAVFREGGYIGEQHEGDTRYYFTRQLTKNGTYTYHFADMAGLEIEYVFEVSEIVDHPLELFFSLEQSMDGAVKDPATLDLNAGDTIYVSPSRDVTISVNDADAVTLKRGEWLEVFLSDELGGMAPFVSATDVYGNSKVTQFSQIIPKDAIAPTVNLKKPVISVKVNVDRAEVQALLLDNIYAVDEDHNLTYEVSFTEDLTVSGTSEVEYTVADSEGNRTTVRGTLRIMSAAEPVVSINDTQVYRDGSYFAESDENMTLTVDVEGQPYCVYMESGIKTVAQMKIAHTDLTENYVTDTEVEIGALEGGFYTVIVQTQSRDYFRIIIYVY